MNSFAVISICLAVILILSCSSVDTRPARTVKQHAVQKRATVADVLGDLTAAASGILNEDRVPAPNCKEIYDAGQTTSGLYRINPAGIEGEFTVFCDMSLRDGGWTVIERRIDDEESFDKNWNAYKNGFGKFNGNFWLGLQKIKDIVDYDSATYELYIGMESFHPTDTVSYSLYNSFGLGTEAEKYSLSIGSLDGVSTAGNSLEIHDGEKFSTPDQDNDSNLSNNCALDFSAGWWYNNCHDSHLTGMWYAGGALPVPSFPDGIIWETWRGDMESLKTVVMAVRPV